MGCWGIALHEHALVACFDRSCVSAARLTEGLRLPDGSWDLCGFDILWHMHTVCTVDPFLV